MPLTKTFISVVFVVLNGILRNIIIFQNYF